MLGSWLQDIRYAARLVRRNPLFALIAALSLAIGIGANTAIFTIANALLFKPPAGVVDADRLVDIGRSQNGQGFDNNSYPNYLDVRRRVTVFSGVYAYRNAEPMSLGGRDGAERIYGSLVTANYFEVLGTHALAGRLFVDNDDKGAGASALAVISHRLWTRRFHADSSVVGQTVAINGHPFVLIGVAPEGFHGTTILVPDVWLPISMVALAMPRTDPTLLTSRASVWMIMGARLKAGETLARARAELGLIGGALEREHPDDNRGRGLRVEPGSVVPGNTANVAAFTALLMGIVALVLAIACANLAGVLLARATTRRREIAVRQAIGASRVRLVRQMLTETTLLFLMGAALGLLLARGMTTLFVTLLPTLPEPIGVSLALDGRVIAFTVVLSLASAILSGLAPALQASKTEVVLALKDEGGGPRRLRLRNAFLIGQVALSLVLVVAAGLLARALHRASSIDPGFDPRGVELASLDLSLGGYTERTGPVFARQVLDRVRALPGVESAALSAMLPLGLGGLGLGGLSVPGVAPPPNGQRFFDADWNVVTPGYFATMKTPLVGGRDFNDGDRHDTPWVVIVNETAARRFWPGQSALGKVLVQQAGRAGTPDATRTLTVVGVARDAKYRSLGDPPRLFVYVPLQQQYRSRTTIVARSTQGQRLAVEIRTLLASMNPNLPIVTSQTLEDYTAVGLVPQRVAASVAGSLGMVGLLLAAIGIYGVTAYMVSSRTREIGIRIALGAQRGDVATMVLRQGITLLLIGVTVGLALAAGASRLMGAVLGVLLFGVGGTDPLTFVGSAALFCAIGLAACYVPARRATQIDAMEALRYE